jgi:GH25 family lysozyme M1 (1,4-beta-N-acetylmuramidase)
MINGIDVSNVNGAVDWNAYRGKIGFAGVKVSEGCWFADPLAKVNVAAVHALGLPAIGYHFLHANLPGTKQAEYFLAHAHQAGLRPGDHIAIDAEDGGLDGLPVSHLVAAAEEFTAELQKHWHAF